LVEAATLCAALSAEAEALRDADALVEALTLTDSEVLALAEADVLALNEAAPLLLVDRLSLTLALSADADAL
jgi:hypothetical protein